MTWFEKVIDAHVSVTDSVSHGVRLQSDRYFVWQEDGSNYLKADGRHVEACITGTTDLFTKTEFDPWKNDFEEALNIRSDFTWELNSIQFEADTGFWHYEWIWSVSA